MSTGGSQSQLVVVSNIFHVFIPEFGENFHHESVLNFGGNFFWHHVGRKVFKRKVGHVDWGALAGGFNFFFIFIPEFGENFQFDEHIFQMRWNHQLESFFWGVFLLAPKKRTPKMWWCGLGVAQFRWFTVGKSIHVYEGNSINIHYLRGSSHR